jgi:hypothetical protein
MRTISNVTGICEECGVQGELTRHHVHGGKEIHRKLNEIPEAWKDKEVVLLCPDCHNKRHRLPFRKNPLKDPDYETVVEFLRLRCSVLGKRLGGLSHNEKFKDSDELKKLIARHNEATSSLYIILKGNLDFYIKDAKEEIKKIDKHRAEVNKK